MVSHHRLPSASASDYLQTAPSAPPATRAASVTSGRSHTRRHRHARTHHGGSSASLAQNEFPIFSHTGDVEIIIASANGRRENRYLLHKLILSQCSGFFEAGTRAEWSGGGSIVGGPVDSAMASKLSRINEHDSVIGSSSRTSSQERRPSFDQQPKRRWRYVLDWQGADQDEAPVLVQRDLPPSLFGGTHERPPPVSNKPPASSESFFRSITNFSALNLTQRAQPSLPAEPGDEVLKDYDNLFRTMYQYPPILDSVNIATAYTECKALLHLADLYDALEIVGSRVDHHLLRFGARLFKQIAKYPPSYLKLGYLARSATIFTEAAIHVIGQWPLGAPQLRGQIDAAVMDLIEDKVGEQQEQQDRVEAKLWRLTLLTSRGDRVTPSNDYLAWLAVSLFRQWFAENTTPPLPPKLNTPSRPAAPPARTSSRTSSSTHTHHLSHRTPAPPPPPPPQALSPYTPGSTYHLLASPSPTAYLPPDDLKRFLKLHPELYTRDNLRRFDRRMEEIKNLAREVVRPLMRNHLELEGAAGTGGLGLGYLCCARVREGELPWNL